jgi:ribA/ribD-fused uncharacterized protein
MTDITSFQGEHRWLSNFYPCQVELDGEEYPSVEHAFQAAKAPADIFYTTVENDRIVKKNVREMVRNAQTPGEAKRMGKKIPLRSDWEQEKVGVMTSLLKQKFSQEPLRSKLIATGDCLLVEGNYWNDTYWGICNGKGTNILGKLLMLIRTELIYGVTI